MPDIGNDFDPNEQEQLPSFDPLPAGWYAVVINTSAMKATRGGDGKYLEVVLEVDPTHHPDHKGRRFWARFNIINRSAQAVSRARSELAKMAKAAGHDSKFRNSDVLHGRRLAVKVKVRPGDANYSATNEVDDYDTVAARISTGASGAGAPSAPTGGDQAAPAAGKTPPWAGRGG